MPSGNAAWMPCSPRPTRRMIHRHPGHRHCPARCQSHHHLHRQGVLPAHLPADPDPRLLQQALAGCHLRRATVRGGADATGGFLGPDRHRWLQHQGVPGIGPKTATQLLQQYGDLASLLAACQQEDAAKALLKLRQHQDEALLAQRLVRLQRDIPSASTCGRSAIHRLPKPDKAKPPSMTGLTLAVDKTDRM